MKKTSIHVHQECRSLLQKAVRRGDVQLVEQVARHLYMYEDPKWVRTRTSVIIFEECWPLSTELLLPLDFDAASHALIDAASNEKHKEAAGLGTLAYVLSTGDTSVLSDIPPAEQEHIVAVCKGIRNPHEFWQSIRSQCINDAQERLIETAHKAHPHRKRYIYLNQLAPSNHVDLISCCLFLHLLTLYSIIWEVVPCFKGN